MRQSRIARPAAIERSGLSTRGQGRGKVRRVARWSCITQNLTQTLRVMSLQLVVPLAAPLTVIGLVSARPLVRFSTIITCVFVYAVSLFVPLSEILTLFGGGAALTRWRGEKWVKELDYVYFALRELGAVLAVNRMNAVGEKLSLPDLFVPIVLASALVVRVIKTRSEINEWNKR